MAKEADSQPVQLAAVAGRHPIEARNFRREEALTRLEDVGNVAGQEGQGHSQIVAVALAPQQEMQALPTRPIKVPPLRMPIRPLRSSIKRIRSPLLLAVRLPKQHNLARSRPSMVLRMEILQIRRVPEDHSEVVPEEVPRDITSG